MNLLKLLMMKITTLWVFVATLMFSLGHAQEKLMIDTSRSTLKWSGEYTFYFGGHHGYVDFKEGYFIKSEDRITGGEFTIDLNTISNEDITKADANEGLVNHLKHPDFFDVENYPLAMLKITKVTYKDPTHLHVNADLTIKGKSLPIEFYAEANYDKKLLFTKFKIDRMRWDISYNSNLRDSAISDAIGFEVYLYL